MDPRRVLRCDRDRFDHDRDPGAARRRHDRRDHVKGTGAADRRLEEKLLAAARGGIKTVLIPEDNAKDLTEISDAIKGGMDIIPVARLDDVISKALVRPPVRLSGKRIPRCRSSRTLPGTKQRVA